jgi:hypothetical protein
MSSAFVREGDDQWLSDVAPSVNALLAFLSRENNGVRVYEKEIFKDGSGREVHRMSNGFCYAKDTDGRWEIVW